MEKVSLVCIFSSYAVATVLSLLRSTGRRPVVRVLAMLMTAAGFTAHTIYLLARSRNVDLPPLLASSHEYDRSSSTTPFPMTGAGRPFCRA